MSQTRKIFLAEDNPSDVFLIKEALSFLEFQYELHRAADGEDALNTLQKLEKEAEPLNLIMLDLNLPKISGHELLAHVRSSHQFRAVPVIVLTSSDSPRDRAQAASMRAEYYFRKPSDLQEFMSLGAIVQQVCR